MSHPIDKERREVAAHVGKKESEAEPHLRQIDQVMAYLEGREDLIVAGIYGSKNGDGSPNYSGLAVRIAVAPKVPKFTADELNSIMRNITDGMQDFAEPYRYDEAQDSLTYHDGRHDDFDIGKAYYREPVAEVITTRTRITREVEPGFLADNPHAQLGLLEEEGITKESIDRTLLISLYPTQEMAQTVVNYQNAHAQGIAEYDAALSFLEIHIPYETLKIMKEEAQQPLSDQELPPTSTQGRLPGRRK